MLQFVFYSGKLFSRKRKRFTVTYYKSNRYYNTTSQKIIQQMKTKAIQNKNKTNIEADR